MQGFTRLTAPADFGSMSYFGRQIIPDEIDRSVWVLPSEVDDLRAHGFTDFDPDAPKVPVSDMTRPQLVAAAVAQFLEKLEVEPDAVIRGRIARGRHIEDAPLPFLQPIAPEDASEENIDGMRRQELFRFLKDKGVPTNTKLKDEELRALALGVFAQQAQEAAEDEALVQEVAQEIADDTPAFAFGDD